MPRSEASIRINRRPEEVWAYVSDMDNYTVWNGAIVSADADGPMAEGTKVRGQIKFLGKKMDYVNEVTQFQAPTRSAYRSIDAPFAWEGGTLLEPDGDGTKITQYLETAETGGFFGKVGDTMATKMYSRQMRSDLENLKEILESS